MENEEIIILDNQEFVNYLRELSDNLLLEFGEFFPFAAQIEHDGELHGVGYQSESESPSSKEAIDNLTSHLESELEENNIRSYCIVYDTRLTNDDYPSGIDCVIAIMKHKADETTIEFSFPYQIKDNGEIEYFDSWCYEI